MKPFSIYLTIAATILLYIFILNCDPYGMDDSWISYRYAKNLANGNGITWNAGEKPIEGATNFLMVIIIAPFIKLGANPLVVTRILSLIASLGTGLLLACLAYRFYGQDKYSSLALGFIYLVIGTLPIIVALGLETAIYTFFLFLSFYYAALFLQSNKRKSIVSFCIYLFLSFLLRPEGIILSLAFIVALFIADGKSLRGIFRILPILSLFFLLPLAIYFTWKLLYFGDLLPNSFYVKIATSFVSSPILGIFRRGGIFSVIEYYEIMKNILLIVIISLAYSISYEQKQHRTLSLVFILFYSFFYLTITPIMNDFHRFEYPMTPFLFLLTFPVLSNFLNYLKLKKQPVQVLGILLLMVFSASNYNALLSYIQISANKMFFNKEPQLSYNNKIPYQMSQKLKGFDDIKKITIGSKDVGIVPYYTEAKWFDWVGLNDRFMAKEKDPEKLVEYFFAKRMEIIIYPTKNNSHVTASHGPLNINLARWLSDPGWGNYTYSGTVLVPGSEDFHFMILNDYEKSRELRDFIVNNVADTVYKQLPFQIGSTFRSGEH